jgi:hypothetical protein
METGLSLEGQLGRYIRHLDLREPPVGRRVQQLSEAPGVIFEPSAAILVVPVQRFREHVLFALFKLFVARKS